jgi:hypothetical protein
MAKKTASRQPNAGFSLAAWKGRQPERTHVNIKNNSIGVDWQRS